MDRILLVISSFCFLFGFAYSMHALGARVFRRSPLNFWAITAGFACQTGFLYARGQQIGRCPLTNLFEVFIFLAWAMVLFYLLIGPTYRLSLLGVFTSPLVFTLQTASILLMPSLDRPVQGKLQVNPWMELHAAVSVVAYGAFALAGIAGVMYLLQERQLKTHNLRSIFFHLPPIRDLAGANRGLILTGFVLLTIGIGAGFAVGSFSSHFLKIAWSMGVWVLYGFIIQAEYRRQLSPRGGAWLSVIAFGVVLSTLWGIRFITDQPAV